MRILPWLRLLRTGALFSPAADVMAGLCVAALPWNAAAGRAMAASVLVYAAGMALNDFADRREDARQRPERPIPRGQIRPGAALALGLGLLLGGTALSPVPLWHGLLAVLVLGYDFLLKRHPLSGALTMGTLRGLNLATAAALGGGAAGESMALLAAASAYGVYILAVTLLGVLEDSSSVRPKAVVSLLAVPPLVALMALFAVQGGVWPAPAVALVPILLFSARNRRVGEWNARTIRGAMLWLLLGTMLYTGLLCLAAGRPIEALAAFVAILPARWIARRIALT